MGNRPQLAPAIGKQQNYPVDSRPGRNGTEVIYIPGNHDTGLRNYAGSTVKEVRIEEVTRYDQ